MTIKSSGPLSMAEINAEFGRGNSLSSYRGTKYYVGSTLGTFPSTISFSDFYGKSRESSVATVIILTSGTSWTVPANWNRFNNKIEVLGGGGAGSNLVTGTRGGGGGAYSRVTNVTLTPGTTVAYAVGAGGAPNAGTGGDTCFGASTIGGAGIIVGAKGGNNSAGGAADSGVGAVRYSGGTGSSSGGGGGGGAAGSAGNGGSSTAQAGGAAGAGSWAVTSGAGGTGGVGDAGGVYGGGGGRSELSYYNKSSPKGGTSYAPGGAGAQGVIVITYFPLAV